MSWLRITCSGRVSIDNGHPNAFKEGSSVGCQRQHRQLLSSEGFEERQSADADDRDRRGAGERDPMDFATRGVIFTGVAQSLWFVAHECLPADLHATLSAVSWSFVIGSGRRQTV